MMMILAKHKESHMRLSKDRNVFVSDSL